MINLINWLSERKSLNLALIVAYIIAIFCLHDVFVNLSVWIMERLTLNYYDKVILVVVFIALLALIYFFYKGLKENPEYKYLKVFLLVATLLFFVVHLKVLLVVNIELIHAVQYGILALLIFPFTRCFGYTLFFGALVGYADEWIQYELLYPERENYFDFNDIITDLLGMGLFLLMLYNIGIQSIKPLTKRNWWSSKVVIFAVLLAVFVVILMQLGIIVTYASAADTNTWLILNEADGPQDFWVEFYTTGRFFHVLTPLHGLIIHLFLIGFYSLMDVFSVNNGVVKS